MMVKAQEKIKPGKGTGMSQGEGRVGWVPTMVMGTVAIANLEVSKLYLTTKGTFE